MGLAYSSRKNPMGTPSSIDALTDEDVYTLIRNRSSDTAIRVLTGNNSIDELMADKIWRISQDAIVKITRSPTEAFMMSYVSLHTSIPVPKVRRVLPNPNSSAQWIVMDYIDGDILETAWPRMSWWKRLYITWLTRRYIQELQSVPIPNPDAPGPFDDSGRSYKCSGYYFTESGGGPFSSYLDMAAWFDRRRFDVLAAIHSATGVVHRIPKFDTSYPLVLCHMDLHTRNFILDSKGRLWIIDWANAGAFPPWLEYAFMAVWADAIRDEFRPPKSWTFLLRFMAGDYRRYKTDYLKKLDWAWCRPLFDHFPLDYFSDFGLMVD